MSATGREHVTVWRTPQSRIVHAYTSCTGAGRHAGHMAKEVLTVAALAAEPHDKVCACMRRRWAAYRRDLGIDRPWKELGPGLDTAQEGAYSGGRKANREAPK